MKRVLILTVLIFLSDNLYCQPADSLSFEEPKYIGEVIRRLGSDTVVFYYDNYWNLVKPGCATVFRISRVDSVLAFFTGRFTDYNFHDSTKVAEGGYSNGKKEGRFSLYFTNGQLAETGNYSDDKKNGAWEYYYENGDKMQTLDFQGNEILIREYWDEKRKKRVESGNGEWAGYTAFFRTSGSVVNGRKNGTWKNIVESQNQTINIEKYEDGKFLSGKMISINGRESYRDTLYCRIEAPPYFLNAELFRMIRCYKHNKGNWEYATYPGGMKDFYKEINEKLVLDAPIIVQGVIRIQMTIDKEGKMTDFLPLSRTGHETNLIHVLQTMLNWRPTRVNGEPRTQSKVITLELR